jgi:hypothetical protein
MKSSHDRKTPDIRREEELVTAQYLTILCFRLMCDVYRRVAIAETHITRVWLAELRMHMHTRLLQHIPRQLERNISCLG